MRVRVHVVLYRGMCVYAWGRGCAKVHDMMDVWVQGWYDGFA